MKMAFGKFKGVEVADLDDSYLRWLHDAIELRDPLLSAVHVEYERRFTAQDYSDAPSDVRVMAQELITAGYRRLALEYHPDLGGQTKTMQLLNGAADFLRQMARRAP